MGPDYPIALVAGAAAYVLGWIYLPDMPLFRRWVDRRRHSAQSAAVEAEVEHFLKKRQALLEQLSPSRRARYHELAAVCHDIESASFESSLSPGDPHQDPRLRKLDELMWTFLRTLSVEGALERFLETERRENLPGLVREAEAEAAQLQTQLETLKAQCANPSLLETRERLLGSRLDRLDALRKRVQRLDQAQANLALVISEQERLEQQIKLIRADAIASKNAEALSARIDSTVEHLHQTNQWLAEMDEFKDLVGDIPQSRSRVGYEAEAPPVIGQVKATSRARVRDGRQ
jgi:hypothetical protein